MSTHATCLIFGLLLGAFAGIVGLNMRLHNCREAFPDHHCSIASAWPQLEIEAIPSIHHPVSIHQVGGER